MQLRTTGWLAMCAAVLLMPMLSLAQPQPGGAAGQPGAGGPGGPGGGRGGPGGRGGFNQVDFYRDSLGATDEEWAVISPRLQKVLELRDSLNRAGRGGGGGRGRGGGGPGGRGGQPVAEDAVSRALQELQTAIDTPATTADILTQKMGNYRAAKEKATAELVVARKALKDILTARQEAVLLAASVLE